MTSPNFQLISSVEGVDEYRFSNGLQVLLIPDTSQSNVAVNIVYHVGSRHEGYGEKGMAHLLEHMLFKSTKNLGDIKKLLSEKGGQANGTTWFDRTNYYEIFPAGDENLEWSLRMEADRMVNATLLQSDLDKEFSVVRNEFEIGENNPHGILNERILSAAYLWHNYGNSTIGSREDIERVKADRLRVFYEKYYQPDNATLIIGGKFDKENALHYIDRYFSPISRPDRILEKTYTVEPAQDGERFVELRRAGDIQLVAAAYHSSAYADEDFAAMDALNEILTADPSGYLYKALVDTNKATGVYGWQPALRDPGFLYLNITIAKDKSLEDARTVFVGVLDNLSDIEFTEKDLKRAKSKLLKNFDNIKNNTIGLTIALTEMIGAGDYRLGFLYRDAIENLSVEDIRRVAEKYIHPGNRTLGVFIPQKDAPKSRGKEYSDEEIAALTLGYQGRDEEGGTDEFEASIANIQVNLTTGRLKNGMKYGLLRKPIKGKKVIATFRFPVGSQEFFHGKNEIKSLMTALLKSGTEEKSKEEIQDLLDELKSQIVFDFRGQTLGVNVHSYEAHFTEIMSLLKELLSMSVFPEREFTKAKEEKTAEIEASKNDPQSIVFSQIGRRTNQYPKGHIFYTPLPEERIEQIREVTLPEITELYSILGADHGYGTVICGLEKETLEEILEDTFGAWTTTAAYVKTSPAFFPTHFHSEKVRTPDKENGAVLARMNLQTDQKSADYPALLMADAILGSGGFLTARIPTRLREKEGISYGTGSFLHVPYDHTAATWNMYAFFNPALQRKVDEALKDELESALKNGFTEEELEANKNSWIIHRKTMLGSDNFLAGTLISNHLHPGIDLEEYDRLEAEVRKLTADEVNSVLRKHLDPEKFFYLYAGDFEKTDK